MKAAHEIREIAAWLAATDIDYLDLRMPDGAVRLGRQDGKVVELHDGESPRGVAPGAAVASLVTVKALSLGVFLHAHPSTGVPLARVGDTVQAGQPLGLLRIGVLLLPVNAAQSGTVAAMRAEDGATVGFGAPLIDLKPL